MDWAKTTTRRDENWLSCEIWCGLYYIFFDSFDILSFCEITLRYRCWLGGNNLNGDTHYDDVVMGTVASQITSLTIVYSTVYSGADQRKHQSSASLAFVLGIHRGPVNSPHKWPVTPKMFPFDDVIIHWISIRNKWIKIQMILFKMLKTLFTITGRIFYGLNMLIPACIYQDSLRDWLNLRHAQ